MTAKEQATLALKGFMFLLFIVGALWGHPPSRAQAPQPNVFQVVPVSGEDIKQDGDIAYMKALMDGDKTTIKEQGLVIIEQGKQLASLDTKLTLFFWFIGAVVGGQIGFTLLPNRKRGEA